MDPLSVTASVLTLVAAAGQSCKFVSSLVRQVNGAQDEIKKQCLVIDALSTTFVKMGTLLGTLPGTVQASSEIVRSLEDFVKEVRAIEVLAHDSNQLVGGRNGQSLCARVKWVLIGEKRWERFIKDLVIWNTVFSNELKMIQM